jgi:FlaA1/EpsC-like NDP-sugar epimerase
VFTGVRPGEKLHEALFDPGMKTRSTAHPEVLEVVGADAATGCDLDRIVSRLEEAARAGDRVSIDALLAEAVPGFRPAARPWDVKV